MRPAAPPKVEKGSSWQRQRRVINEMARWPTYPIAACARGVVADIRIVRVVRATAGTPLIAIDEGHVACTDLGRPIPTRRLARKGGRGGWPSSEPPVGEDSHPQSRF